MAEVVGALAKRNGGNFGARLIFEPSRVVGRYFGGQKLAAEAIDALAHDAGRVIETDTNFTPGGMQDPGGRWTPLCQVMRRTADQASVSVT